MANNVGVNITCNSNCSNWCPRFLRVLCCCFKCTGDDTSDTEQKTNRAALKALSEGCEHHTKNDDIKNNLNSCEQV